MCLLPEAFPTGTAWRTARINAPSEIRFSPTFGCLLGEISCRSSRVARTRPLRRPKMFFLETGTRTSDILHLSPRTSDIFRLVLIFADRLFRPDPVASGRGTRLSRLSPRKIFCRSKCVACPVRFCIDLRYSPRRKASRGALSRIVRAALIPSHQGEALDFLILYFYCFGCPLVCFGFGIKFPGTDSYLTARALSNSASDSRTDAASFPLDSLARPPRANGTRPRVRLWLKKSGAPTGGHPTARRRDPTRRRAPPPRCRALLPHRAAPQPRTLRGLRFELLADGRLQRAHFRRLRTPTHGICRRVTGVSVRRPAASRPAGARISFCASASLPIISRSPLTSSTLNVTE